MIKDFESTVVEYFDAKSIEPVIDSEFEIEKIREAHELVESNKTIGKVLLKINSEIHTEF